MPNWLYRGHGVNKVEVFVRDGVVASIDIMFDSTTSEDFFDVVHRQLGPGWVIEHQRMNISEEVGPKNPVTVDRTIETKKTKLYSAMMTDYDEIFKHVAGPVFQGILEIRLLDQTL